MHMIKCSFSSHFVYVLFNDVYLMNDGHLSGSLKISKITHILT